jgi:thioredoxin reductase
MVNIGIIGDGPAGLSAAMLLAKKGESAQVFGKNTTKMHHAYLYNYPGVRQLDGSEFIETARDQCQYFGAKLHDKEITDVSMGERSIILTDEGDQEYSVDYLIIATGHFSRGMFSDLGVKTDDSGRIQIDDHGRTSIEDVYAAGVATRTKKIQATVSVGQGASAALDILEQEQDGMPHDFDTRALVHLDSSVDEARYPNADPNPD